MKNKNNNKNRIVKTTNKATRQKLKIPKSVSDDPETKRYWLALTDPFNEAAVGARVPDLYAAHTATYTIRATHTIVANAAGNATLFMLPNVVASAFLPQGTSADFVTTIWGDNTTTTQSRWGVDSNALGSKLDNYRIVGMGMRVTNLSSMTNSQGKFLIGAYPVSSTWHTKDFQIGLATMPTNAGNTQAETASQWGVPLTSAGSYAMNLLVQYPGTQVRSALEVGENAFDVVSRPVDPRAFQFRAPNGSYEGWETAGATAGAATVTGNADFLDLNGFEAMFVALQGAVASTSSYDVEVVYHIEGRPYLAGISGTTAQNEIIAPAASGASPVNPIGFFEAVSHAVRQPAVKMVIEQAASFMNPLLGQFVQRVL